MYTKISGSLSRAALLEQMAEEAAELAQAALKTARILRKENPTPVTLEQSEDNLREEFTDLILCANVLKLFHDPDILLRKYERWISRIGKDGE